eukprot:scaffold69234_cov30-Tisochrysis_lutea.AAC.1
MPSSFPPTSTTGFGSVIVTAIPGLASRGNLTFTPCGGKGTETTIREPGTAFGGVAMCTIWPREVCASKSVPAVAP